MSKICELCGEEFRSGRVKSNHVRWKHKDTSEKRERITAILSVGRSASNDKIFSKSIVKNRNCKSCGKIFKVTETEFLSESSRRYVKCCSVKCQNSRVWSKDTNIKRSSAVSKSIKDKWANDEDYRKKCLKGNSKIRFTSKGEVELRTWLIAEHPNDNWTFGGHVRQDGIGLVRDVYSNKLRVCIEYDGAWHFKEIHGQLKKKQEKDAALEKWCKENGYKLIRIREEIYKKNPEIWKNVLYRLATQETISQTIKFY